MVINNHSQSGFALLMTLVVVGVVLSVGIVILDLSIKQVRLSTNAGDSEVAFHAANAGVECARYWRRRAADTMATGGTINSVTCFEVTPAIDVAISGGADALNPGLPSSLNSIYHGDGAAYDYRYEFTWGDDDSRCTKIHKVFAVADIGGAGVTVTHMDDRMPGYPSGIGTDFVCTAGSRCTVLSVKGYNQQCSTVGRFGTVEREVLLQF